MVICICLVVHYQKGLTQVGETQIQSFGECVVNENGNDVPGIVKY